MRVLYVSHTSHVGGGERSLLELLGALPSDVDPHMACPPGPLHDAVRSAGVPVTTIPGTDGSLKLHPVQTPRALADMARAAMAVRRLGRRLEADLVHGNSVRAGLIAAIASDLGGPPAIAHVRDCLPDSTASRLVTSIVCRRAAGVIANSSYTLEHFRGARALRMERVVHNPVDAERFQPEDRSYNGHAPTLGVVAQLTPWKGQADAVRTLALVKRDFPSARLVLAGSAKFVSRATRFDNRAYVRQLQDLIRELGVEEDVDFLGEVPDPESVYRSLDVLLVPSWEEPFGRAVVEGMAAGVPVVSTEVGGPAEIVSAPDEGVLLPAQEPETWARAVSELLADPDRRRQIARCARLRATTAFTVDRHVRGVLDAYESALEPARRKPLPREGVC
ncbi:MAG TPA: glycosyltransferase family 4 protein [Thermoleophilaceae bacterium]|nr:glycosyltransferase family 4 protein [Thermoleophilaceae bacterium]